MPKAPDGGASRQTHFLDGGFATVWPLRGRLRLRRVLGPWSKKRFAAPLCSAHDAVRPRSSITDQGLRTVPKAPDGGASRQTHFI